MQQGAMYSSLKILLIWFPFNIMVLAFYYYLISFQPKQDFNLFNFDSDQMSKSDFYVFQTASRPTLIKTGGY